MNKMMNGIVTPLSPQELVERQAEETLWQVEQAAKAAQGPPVDRLQLVIDEVAKLPGSSQALKDLATKPKA